MRTPFALLLILLAAAPAYSVAVTTETSGEIIFLEGTESYTKVMCGAFGPGWTWISQVEAYDRVDSVLLPERRELTATFDIPATAASTTFDEAAWRQSDQVLGGRYDFTINDTLEFNSLWVSFYLPCDRYAGNTVTAYNASGQLLQSVVLPADFSEPHLFYQEGVRQIEVALGSSIGYDIRLSPPANVLLQDNRAWGGREFELRFELLGPYSGSPVPAGTLFSRPFTVTFPSPVDFQLDPNTAASQTDTTGWIPFVMPWDGAPLDLSWLNEKPAGQHGFLTVTDGRLEFENGLAPRFWGVCVTAGANFPTHAQSEKIAERMAKFGVNIVRTHHADAGWSNPNFFDETYADTQHFDADALDRFDYFIYSLKQHGIYVYLDQLVHRKFTVGDGVVSADQLDYAAKPYTLFDPTLIALQKQFSHDLWTHVNPYTGLAYKDDPAIVLMEFTNENDIVTHDVTVEPYATQFEQMWQDWATANAVDPNQPVRYVTQRTSDVLRFIDELQQQYYSDMYAYLRSIGVRIPIAGNTWLVYGANLPSQVTMDLMDAHAYWDHPYDNYSRWHNRPQVKADPDGEGNNFAGLAVSRVNAMPFVCSEWGHPWPNEWRAEGPIATAAVAALQGWDGVLAYTYRHGNFAPVDYLTGAFDTFNDPTVFGLMPASALLFRRGDVVQSSPATAVLWQDGDVFGVPQLSLWGGLPSYRSLVEATAVVTALSTPSGVKAVVGPTDYQATAGPTWTESDTGELRRDWSAGIGTVDTPRSQASYGFLGAAGAIELSDVSVVVTNPFAVVSVTSLDGRDIALSNRLLVTAVGRAENTGMVYNLTHTKLHDPGTGPILIEPITGEVAIRNFNAGFAIYAIGPDGSRNLLGEQAAAEDWLLLNLTPSAGTIYYELVGLHKRDVLLEVHPNERAPGVDGLLLGDPYWTPPGAGATGTYTSKYYEFAGSPYLWIQVCGQAQRASRTPSGEPDRLQMLVDGAYVADYWADNMAAPPSWQWNGNFALDLGRRKTLRFLSMGVPGVHTITFKAVQYPIIWWIKVTDLEPEVIEAIE